MTKGAKKTELSENTLKNYQAVINGILRELGLEKEDEKGDWIVKNWSKILSIIDASKSIHTQKNRTAVLKVWCDLHDLSEKYGVELEKRMGELAAKVHDEYSSNKMNAKQEANWIGVQEMREIVEKMRTKLPANVSAIDTYSEYKQLIRYMMLLIHIHIPLRNDLACAKVYLSNDMPKEQDNSVNYIAINKTKKSALLYLNDYKTQKEYGQKVIHFPADVAKELVKYYDVIIRMSPNRWFIRDSEDDDKCISRVSYTKWFNTIFSDTGKKVSTTQIRRAVVSDLYKVDEDEMKKKQELANVMGHSVQQAGLSYAKHLKDGQK
jgi:hypothetical protein